jgi:hypothetical protein
MMIQGRFHHDYSGDDLLFGADFDSPISPPPGTSIAVRICRWLDPSLIFQVDSEASFMFSPIISSMNSLSILTADQIEPILSPTHQSTIISDQKAPDVGKWRFAGECVPENPQKLFPANSNNQLTSYDKRKKYFGDEKKRKAVEIKKDYVYCMDFYDAYFDLNNVLVA